jgi:hypothetical protein
MVQYASATSKGVATARMYALGGEVNEPLGPGSKEKRSALEALGHFLGLDLADTARKVECGRLLAGALGVDWDTTCWSTGDTITLVGLNRLVDAAVIQRLVEVPTAENAELLRKVAESRPPTPDSTDAPAMHTKGTSMPLTNSEIEQSVAEHIAKLSEDSLCPAGISPAPQPISASDVSFVDGSWRDRLADVQGWLHLPEGLAIDSSSEDFDQSLGGALGLNDLPDGENWTINLLERLQERLERASDLRDRFLESMDDEAEGSATLETATQTWVSAWDEVIEEDEAEESGPIDAEAATWHIHEFVQHAADGELDLSPSYQRADVWPTADAQLLIESVLRGIPLPSVIILERDDEDRSIFEIVDGKQRLTSLLRFVGAHPKALEIVAAKAAEWDVADLPTIFRTDYPTFKKLWNKNEQTRMTAQVERANYFPFPLRGGEVRTLSGKLARLRGKYYSEIRDEPIDVQGKSRTVKAVFEQSTYKVPVILYRRVTRAQVHEVFSLYNKQGKHLNAEEIRNALYHQLDLMRALLATAGDADDVRVVADFLVDDWDDLSSTPATLTEYGFGRAGYKRTKLLSWVAAVLFQEYEGAESRSTAGQINLLLKRVSEDKRDRLRDRDVVRDAMLLLDHGLDAHVVAAEGWAPTFRNSQSKGKWQELQLVACLIGLSSAVAVREDLADDLEDAIDNLRRVSASWKRPLKTQSRQQWEFVARVVVELLDLLGIEVEEADAALRDKYGASGLSGLARLHTETRVAEEALKS